MKRFSAWKPSGATVVGICYFHIIAIPTSPKTEMRPAKSRDEAAKAVEVEERPYFEMLSQLALCEIRLGNLETAEDLLARLDNEFRRVREDIRINLRCKLELTRKKYTTVIALSDKNPNKNDKFYKEVRRKALLGDLASAALADDVRAKYKHELERLNDDLKTTDAKELETLY
jgi:hypothetical protein